MGNTLIKWPGGKTKEIKYVKNMIPSFDRYVEPFFGGGAMFFYLQPQKSVINDISKNLIDFYVLVKEQSEELHNYLTAYQQLISGIIAGCNKYYPDILDTYLSINWLSDEAAKNRLTEIIKAFEELHFDYNMIILDKEEFKRQIINVSYDKMKRTAKNEKRSAFTVEDLKENLITGFTGGMYMYFRDIYNEILFNKIYTPREYNAANFYYIREYCYGSMFRYNSKGEFNIPYGGMSYNKKDFKAKIDNIFSEKNKKLFGNTGIFCEDFEEFFDKINLTKNDFMFLDPPYDTDFSNYGGKEFTQNDHIRLAKALRKTKAKFILIIKNTDFIYSLYKDDFNISYFDKMYTYNMRSRNNRKAEHLIVSNMAKNLSV